MSMFNWNAKAGETVVSHRFWIYWAITVPITIAIFVFFVGFILISVKKDGKEDEDAGSATDRHPSYTVETIFQGIRRRRTQHKPDMLTEEKTKRPTKLRHFFDQKDAVNATEEAV